MPVNTSPRKKTIRIITFGILCLILSVYLISRMTMLQGFMELEKKFVRTNISRMQEAFKGNIKHQDRMLSDWSNWDDVCSFIEDGNEPFIKSNLMNQTLATIGINYIIFVNNQNKIVYSKGVDLSDNHNIPLPKGLDKYISSGGMLVRHADIDSSISGLLMLEGSPLIATSRPILTGEHKGPVRGTLIFLKYLDPQEIKKISKILYLPLEVMKFEDPSLPADFKEAHDDFLLGTKFIIKSLNTQNIAGYSIINDIDGNPLLILKMTADRDIYNYGIKTLTYFIIAFILVGFIFGGIIFFPLEKEITFHKQTEKMLMEEKQKAEIASDQLKNAYAQLYQSEKMASIGQLAAGVAHEINNPVGFVMSNLRTLTEYIAVFKIWVGYCETLSQKITEKQNAETEEVLRQIKESSEQSDIKFILSDVDHLLEESLSGTHRIRDIVQSLKSFARVDEAQIKKADINEGIEATLKIVWNELKYKGEVIKKLNPLPLIRCYPGQLNQVFMNLLVNASQAIPEKGIITIETKTDEKDILICIADTGTGISEKNLKKIFDPFFTTKDIGQGTGLGLSISYGIIKKHNGTIEVESTVGKGTVFTIRLPQEGIQG